MKIPASVAVGLLALVLACEAPDPGAQSVTVRDSAGVRIVESSVPTWSPDEAWTIHPLPAGEIGREGAGSDRLFDVVSVEWLSSGEVAVAGAGTRELLFFDLQGDLTRASGRDGEGPGEFAGMSSMHRCDGDTLVVYGAGRLSMFDGRGRFLRSEQTVPRLADAPNDLEGVSPDCSAFLFLDVDRVPRPRGPSVYNHRAILYWASLASPSRDTVAVFPWNDYVQIVPLPFGRFPTWATHGSRVYLASSDRFEVRIFDRARGLQTIIRWDAEAQPVSPADRDRFASHRARLIRENPELTGVMPALDGLPLPEYRPGFSDLLVDDQGNVWVKQYPLSTAGFWENAAPEPSTSSGPESWWVFGGSTGEWLGAVQMPAGISVEAIQDDHVLAVFRDINDVETVRFYRLNKSG